MSHFIVPITNYLNNQICFRRKPVIIVFNRQTFSSKLTSHKLSLLRLSMFILTNSLQWELLISSIL